MKKKIVLALAAAGSAVAVLPLFAAFEAHVINVTATIENALKLQSEDIKFGTTFPEEILNQPLTVALSDSFIKERRVDDVEYVIRQKPKCGQPIPQTNPVQYSAFAQVTDGPEGTFVCPQGFVQLPLLCPFLSKHPDNDPTPGNDGSLDAYHGPLTGWTLADTVTNEVKGLLSKEQEDEVDTWNIDLHVPCFKGSCAQDNKVPPQYQEDPSLEHQLFGCDLWVETTGISET